MNRKQFLNLCFFVLLLGMTTWGLVWAEQAEEKPVRTSPLPEDSIQNSQNSTNEVAEKIVELQEQLGGSIVRNRPAFQEWNSPPDPKFPHAKPASFSANLPIAAGSKEVIALRDAAWQIEKSAHRLETLELYRQADALRELARDLRQDARGLSGKAKPR